MWIFTSNGFFSVGEDARKDIPGHKDNLMVRARFRGDLHRAFGPLIKELGAKVHKTQNRDYLYRAYLPKDKFAAYMAKLVSEINYNDFKPTIKEPVLKDMAMGMWYEGLKAQQAEDERIAERVGLWKNEDRGDIKNDKLP